MSVVLIPVRVKLSRKCGWRMPPGTRSVAAPGPFANPYRPSVTGLSNRQSVRMFEDWIRGPAQAELLARVKRELKGLRLACWCGLDQSCHADVLAVIANEEDTP
jgi:hypothetical protein